MTNRLFSILRYTAIIVIVAGLFVVSGCDEGPEGPTMNIKDLIASDQFKQATTGDAGKSLDTLNYYINLYPELQALMTATTPTTFFAPSNAAFQSLKATPGFPTNPDALKLINKSLVGGVLTYHFVEGKKMTADLTSGVIVDTKFTDPLAPAAVTQMITINTDLTLKASPLAANGAIHIVTADQEATNGVVHVIEAVMIPPSTGEKLIPILGQVAGSIILAESFSNLTKVIMFADASFTENAANVSFKVTTWLAMPINGVNGAVTANLKGITFFAPPNAAGTTPIFTEAAANGIIALGAIAARSFLLNHLVVSGHFGTQPIGMYTVANAPVNNPHGITKFAGLQTIRPMTGANKQIFVGVGAPTAATPTGVRVTNERGIPDSTGGQYPNPNSFKPILLGDQAAQNGYFHVIGGVLQ